MILKRFWKIHLNVNVVFPFLFLPRMTILPSTDKLKILLNKVKEFHQKFTEQYS